MDERQRQIFEKAYAILDRRADDEREHQEWLARHYDPITERVDRGEDEETVEPSPQLQRSAGAPDLVYKTFETPAPPLTDAQIFNDKQGEALVHVIVELRAYTREVVEKELSGLREEVAALRADLTITRSIIASRNVLQINRDDGVVRKSDAEVRFDVA